MKYLEIVGRWIWQHKTKITGFLLVVCGALQANTIVLQGVLTPKQYAYFTIIVGCVVAGLGFLNTPRASE